MSSFTTSTDVIDQILGIDASSPIAALRAQRPELASQMQDYYDALFEPAGASASEFSRGERLLTAIRVASHTGSVAVIDWYELLAVSSGVESAMVVRVKDVARPWHDEGRLAAAIRHADQVTSAPSQTSKDNLDALKIAGFSPAGIVSLAQVIAYVSYQLRLIAGLRVFGEIS